MESSSTRRRNHQITKQPCKRLIFDRRYGYVFDEWKHPAEEALAGGRGMFCILPLAQALLKTASFSINLVRSCAVKVLEKPEILSPRLLQASFSDQLYKVKSSIQKKEFVFAWNENFPFQISSNTADLQLHPHEESSESQYNLRS